MTYNGERREEGEERTNNQTRDDEDPREIEKR